MDRPAAHARYEPIRLRPDLGVYFDFGDVTGAASPRSPGASPDWHILEDSTVSFTDSEVGPAMRPHSSGSAVGVAEVSHALVRDQLSDYLDNALPQTGRARVDEHLAQCEACRAVEATLRATSKSMAALPQEKAPPSAKLRLLEISEA